jgi:hypothetical protein
MTIFAEELHLPCVFVLGKILVTPVSKQLSLQLIIHKVITDTDSVIQWFFLQCRSTKCCFCIHPFVSSWNKVVFKMLGEQLACILSSRTTGVLILSATHCVTVCIFVDANIQP